MDTFNKSLAAWAAMLGAIVGLFGLIQSLSWLAGIGAFFLTISLVAFGYAIRERLLVRSAAVKVNGRSVDSLNIANLRRRVNHSLVVQDAYQVATVDGEDLTMIWRYTGYCKAKKESAVEFSIDADNNIPFEELECFAYDLQNDPKKEHKIRPILLGADGNSKKIAVPLLEPLETRQPFSVLLTCELPGCLKSGVDYYTSTLSLAQHQVPQYVVRLIFLGDRPKWLRVYTCNFGETSLLKDLQPLRQADGIFEYVDVKEKVNAQSARIYVFQRDRVTRIVSERGGRLQGLTPHTKLGQPISAPDALDQEASPRRR